MNFSKILFPVDFSERSRIVAPFVRAAAKRHGAALTLANFIEIPALWYGTAEAPCAPDLNISGMIDAAGEELKCFAAEFFPDIPANILVEEGEAGAAITELVRELGFDLVMMPTRGRGRFRAALLGSATAKVLHDVNCAVWTAAHAETPEYAASPEWGNVVCAIDATPDAMQLIRCAGQMATSFGSKVHLVHALPPTPGTRMEHYLSRDFDEGLKQAARQEIDAMQKDAGTDFRLCVQAGDAAAIIAAAAEKDHADLVLIGRGALPHFAGRLRTHVYSIVRDAPCPVLSI
jgi:nucleotide-binding universal stress UspA family protein